MTTAWVARPDVPPPRGRGADLVATMLQEKDAVRGNGRSAVADPEPSAVPHAALAGVAVRCRGPMRISVDGMRVRQIGGKPGAVLAYLATRESATRDELSALLWGTRFRTQARQSVRQALLTLRRELGEDAIRAEGEIVSLALGALPADGGSGDGGSGDGVPSSDVAALRAVAAMPAERRAAEWARMAAHFPALAPDEPTRPLAGHGITEPGFLAWVAELRQEVATLWNAVHANAMPAEPDALPRLDIPTVLAWTVADEDALYHRHGVERGSAIVAAAEEAVGQAAAAFGGSPLAGRGRVMCFGYEADFETAAEAGIDAALRATAALANIGGTFGIGVASGVALHDPRMAPGLWGTPITTAERLAERAVRAGVPVVSDARTQRATLGQFAFERVASEPHATDAQAAWTPTGRRWRPRHAPLGRPFGRLRGRADELAQLNASWDAATGGEGRAALVTGTAGIGKSRLCAALRANARAAAAARITLQCRPFGVRRPFHPLVDFLSGLGAGGQAEPVRALLELLEDPDGGFDPEAYRDRVFDALGHALDALCAAGPLLLLIEDVHWADELSLDAIEWLIDELQDRALLVVLTARDGPQADRTAALAVERIPLGELNSDDLTALVAHRRRRPPGDVDVRGIVERAGGNPLFAEALASFGRGTPGSGAQVAQGARGLPVSIEGLLHDRVEALDGETLTVLRGASALGFACERRDLERLVADRDGTVGVGAALDRLRDAGLLAGDPHDRGRVAFRHALIAEATYNATPRPERRDLHHAIAERGLGGTAADASVLAYHLFGAERWAEAAEAAMDAAEDAIARSAVATGRGLLAMARRALLREGRERNADPTARRGLELRLATLQGTTEIARNGSGAARTSRHYDRAIEFAERADGDDDDIGFPLYWGWWFTATDFRTMAERYELLERRFAEAADREIKLQTLHCGWASAVNSGAPAHAIALVTEGLDLYDPPRARESCARFGNHDTRVCGLGVRAQALWLRGEREAAMADAARAVSAAGELGHVGSILHAYDSSLLVASWDGRRDDVVRLAVDMEKMARARSIPGAVAKSIIFAGWARGATDAEAGLAQMERGLELQRRTETTEDEPHYEDMRAELLIAVDRAKEAVEAMEAAIDASRRSGHLVWIAALHRRRALALRAAGASRAEVETALETACLAAGEQGAVALERMAARDLERLVAAKDAAR